jgi:hypothetical protein
VRTVRDGRFETLKADAYVMALGSYSPFLLAPLRVPCNVYPAKGYSATIDIGEHRGAPTVSLTDFAWKIVLTRLGERLRVAGTAELTGWETSLNPKRCEALTARTFELFRMRAIATAFGTGPDYARQRVERATDRQDALSRPVPEHRTRHAGPDDGVRVGARARGRRRGPQADVEFQFTAT